MWQCIETLQHFRVGILMELLRAYETDQFAEDLHSTLDACGNTRHPISYETRHATSAFFFGVAVSSELHRGFGLLLRALVMLGLYKLRWTEEKLM